MDNSEDRSLVEKVTGHCRRVVESTESGRRRVGFDCDCTEAGAALGCWIASGHFD